MGRGCGLVLLALGVVAAVVGGFATLLAFARPPAGAGMIGFVVAVDLAAFAVLLSAFVILRQAKPIGMSAADSGPRYPANTRIKHELDGTPYTTLYTPPVKGKSSPPPVLTVSTPADCSGEFQMTVETWFDRLGKRLGLAVELQTGDESFDDQCYIRTDTPEFTAAYLADPLKRVAILDLRQFGFLEVALRAGKLTAKRVGFDPKRHDRPELIEDVGARLVLLARNLPPHQPEFDNRVGQRRRFWQVSLWLLLLGFAATIFSLIAYTPLSEGELLLRALPVLLLGWPGFVLLSAWLLSGTSRSHIAWGQILVGSLFLFPIGSVGVVALSNGALDASPATVHNALIVDKYTTKSKNSTNYHVRCQSWRKPGETESFQIPGGEYDRAAPNRSKLVVTTRAGWLGMEWLESKYVDAQPKP